MKLFSCLTLRDEEIMILVRMESGIKKCICVCVFPDERNNSISVLTSVDLVKKEKLML